MKKGHRRVRPGFRGKITSTIYSRLDGGVRILYPDATGARVRRQSLTLRTPRVPARPLPVQHRCGCCDRSLLKRRINIVAAHAATRRHARAADTDHACDVIWSSANAEATLIQLGRARSERIPRVRKVRRMSRRASLNEL
jgi:hypothetical protein